MNPSGNEPARPLTWLRTAERWAAAALVAVILVLRMAERWAAAALVAVILVLMAVQVVARYVFGAPIPWSEEVACFAFVWLAFLGGALVAGEEKLLRVDVISPWLGRRGRLAVECLSAAGVTAGCLAMVVGGAPFVRRLAEIVTPAAGIPRRWLYLASAVGLSLIALHTVANTIVAVWRGTPEWADEAGAPDELDRESALR